MIIGKEELEKTENSEEEKKEIAFDTYNSNHHASLVET